MKCGWMDWCGSDYTDSLDLSILEELFGIDETKLKQALKGGYQNLLYIQYLYIMYDSYS